ncbi:cysteine desulfurase family protein [Niallia taxi]|uniref:cysteine desulfurase family protein n=1 Tax=Niallia taxi TaxID=2499688 RepID=UPI0011AA5056|nr:cysteine desulfurase family protein [Niallia taxi]MCT2347358.1 cysteine desulfurase [Niallia taxi]
MIYLDNSATTKPFPEVIESYTAVAANYFGNPSSIHRLGMEAEKLLMQARAQIAAILEVKPSEIYFTSGGTEGNNMALKGASSFYKTRGKHIITTRIEHDSIKRVMEQLEQDGFTITYLPVDEQGFVAVDDIKKHIQNDTILVSIMHVNNETGAIQEIAAIGELLKQYPKILFHVDGVQAVGKTPFSFKDHHIDLYTMSAHKFHGLKGNGILYAKEGLLLSPLLAGGGQERNMRSGTENVAGAVSTAKALRMQMENYKMHFSKMQELNKFIRKQLESMDRTIVHSPVQSVPHIINFSAEGIKAEVLIHALEEKGIFISTTSACSSKTNTVSKTLLAMGVPEHIAESSFRISLAYENNKKELEEAMTVLKETIHWLRGVMNK